MPLIDALEEEWLGVNPQLRFSVKGWIEKLMLKKIENSKSFIAGILEASAKAI